MRVNAGDFEHRRDQVGIEWRLPSRGAGCRTEWIGKPTSSGNGVADPSHFIAEPEIIFIWFEPVGMREQDVRQSQRKRDRLRKLRVKSEWPRCRILK